MPYIQLSSCNEGQEDLSLQCVGIGKGDLLSLFQKILILFIRCVIALREQFHSLATSACRYPSTMSRVSSSRSSSGNLQSRRYSSSSSREDSQPNRRESTSPVSQVQDRDSNFRNRQDCSLSSHTVRWEGPVRGSDRSAGCKTRSSHIPSWPRSAYRPYRLRGIPVPAGSILHQTSFSHIHSESP